MSPLTFALQALSEETLEQMLAVLTHGGPRVRVHGERVRQLHAAGDHLSHPGGTIAKHTISAAQREALLLTQTQIKK